VSCWVGCERDERKGGVVNAAAVEERGAKECRGCVTCSCVRRTLKGTLRCECNAVKHENDEQQAGGGGGSMLRCMLGRRRAAGNKSLLV
jgi:hypothetical protein